MVSPNASFCVSSCRWPVENHVLTTTRWRQRVEERLETWRQGYSPIRHLVYSSAMRMSRQICRRSRRRDLCTGGKFGIFCDHHDAITHKIQVVINIPIAWERLD